MKARWEIKDSQNPKARGSRFTDRARAERELAKSVPAGRFYLKDRAS